MKRVKIKTKMDKDIRWITCGNCGHTLYGTTTMSAKISWPSPVKPPKKEVKK